MIIYFVSRVVAWLWGCPWPVENADTKSFLVFVSGVEMVVDTVAVVCAFCGGIYAKHPESAAANDDKGEVSDGPEE